MLGSTQLNQFEGHRFQREEDLFVRETTQNSIDNPRGKKKPRIVFRLVTLTGAKKTRFLKTTELSELYENKSLLEEATEDNELRTVGGSGALNLLFIEDFNTTGLDGVIADPKSNWMRFNLHGDAQKLKEEQKIGSYGYGKSVLARAAGTRTFIVFTAIEPNATDGQVFRLMGHTFQNFYKQGDGHYSGRGWLCEGADAKGDPIPFANETACTIAKELGFSERDGENTGTSFLLIGTTPAQQPITINSIRHAFETWWWPSLLDDRIDVEFWENGAKVEGPAPRTRTDLVPYIKCKSKLDNGIGDDVDQTIFQPLDGKKLGKLGLTLAADETVFTERSHPKAPGPRRVARTRSRSGMITEYRDFGTEKRVAFVGYYSADDDIDGALKLSEPAAHDEWSPTSQRLSRLAQGRRIVETVDERTKAACYNFQRKHSAARAPLADRLPELEKLLGAAFDPAATGSGTSTGGSKKSESLTSVEFVGSAVLAPVLEYGKASNRINGTIRFSLRSGYRKTKRVGIWLVLNVAEDANQAKGEPLSLKVTDVKSGKRIYAGINPKFIIEVTPGQAVDIHVQSSGYPRHQTILFDHGEYKA
jgi:hypothetical protein